MLFYLSSRIFTHLATKPPASSDFKSTHPSPTLTPWSDGSSREYYRGKYHCTVDLLFDWFGISCMTTDDFCFYLQNRLIQTSQAGGQWYSDTSPFSILWLKTTVLAPSPISFRDTLISTTKQHFWCHFTLTSLYLLKTFRVWKSLTLSLIFWILDSCNG